MFQDLGKRRETAGSLPVRSREAEGGSFIVDRLGTVLGFDEGMERLTGWPAVEIVGRNKDHAGYCDADGQDHARAFPIPIYEGAIPVPDGSQTLELRLRCSDGCTVDVDAEATLLPGRGERIKISVRRVLTRSGGVFSAHDLDGFDPLTGLGGGRAFGRRLAEAYRSASRRGRPLALVLADVDHLRKVNDLMGREVGDRVLRKLAGIFRATVPDEDLIARIGDDDFAILLPEAGRGDARQIAAKLRSTVERFRFFGVREDHDEDDLRVTLSLGAASFPADADTDDDLMKRAEEALGQARAFGRNRVWCYTRRPRVPVEVPIYFDSAEDPLVGFTRDLSPSGVFVQTSVSMEIGMRCAFAFPLPNYDGRVHVIGRVVRTVPPQPDAANEVRIPGMGIEFERFGPEDRRAIESFLHAHESMTLRPETGICSV
jgi:diguanylate cyclase (GGDEF)-like protein